MMNDETMRYSVKEAATAWGFSVPTLYKLLRSPGCPSFKFNGMWIIPKERFDEWMMHLADERASIEFDGEETIFGKIDNGDFTRNDTGTCICGVS